MTLVSSIIISLTVVALFSFQRYWKIEYLFREDGFFESLTAISFISSSIFLAYMIFWRKIQLSSFREDMLKRKVQLFSMVFFLGIGLEEISWGQRIFSWRTPPVMSAINIQNETNIHNFFNAYFVQIYQFITIYLLFIWVLAWIFFRPKNYLLYKNIFPNLNMLLMFLVIVLAAILGRDELVEILASIFTLFYVINISAQIIIRKHEGILSRKAPLAFSG